MKKAIVLLSGGLDSSTCLAIASQSYETYAVSFDYDQRHQHELTAARKIAKQFAVKDHIIVPIANMSQIARSALTSHDIPVEDFSDSDTIPSTYVPARNTLFLSYAMAWAETLKADAIFIGVSAIDYSGYPDCRPEFINAFQNLIHHATDASSTMQQCKIIAPLIQLSKKATIEKGVALGVDYSLTYSCYRLDKEGKACGTCDSCVLRKQGFTEAGLSDPTQYLS